ncbi:unnamed protein product, partial [Brassicogethes aeneus]
LNFEAGEPSTSHTASENRQISTLSTIISNPVNRLVQYSNSSTESESDKTPIKEVLRTRKRKRNPHLWKKNQRKEKYQKGLRYVNAKGVAVVAREIKTDKDCGEKCRYNCKLFNEEIRMEIKNSYYSLDQNGKYAFLLNMTKKILVKRKRSSKTNYKSFSFEYYFQINNEPKRVCKPFFLNTLCISQKPIYNVHLKKSDSGTTQTDKRGKNTKDRINELDKNRIKQHIEAFPCVESYYCRKDSKKKYLDPTLNVQKMYDLYVEKCNNEQIEPKKLSLYRHIFNYNFNLEFLQPKTDRCDVCEDYNLAKKEKRVDDKKESDYKSHIDKKNWMRQKRENDKTKNKNPNRAVICFDLENVINLPKSEVSVLFYKQKLTVYNLTAHCSLGKDVFCAMWSETMCGRSGNDISSAFIQILEKVVLIHPNITEIVTWSDSCVPQNRNSLISVAVADFLKRYPGISCFTMKYSIPGHSCIQVVDNIHSRIEKAMKVTDIWSPLSLIRILLKIDRKKAFHIINMKLADFKNFQHVASFYQYDKVSQLRFLQGEPYHVAFKKDNHQAPFVTSNLLLNLKEKEKQKKVIFLPLFHQSFQEK